MSRKKNPMTSREKWPFISYGVSIESTKPDFSIIIQAFLSCTLDILDFLLTSKKISSTSLTDQIFLF